MYYLHLLNLNSVLTKLLNSTVIQPDFFKAHRKWFQSFTLALPEIFAKIPLYTTLTQPDFYYISKIWFQDPTPAHLDYMVVHYTRTTLLLLHLYNFISGFYTCTA